MAFRHVSHQLTHGERTVLGGCGAGVLAVRIAEKGENPPEGRAASPFPAGFEFFALREQSKHTGVVDTERRPGLTRRQYRVFFVVHEAGAGMIRDIGVRHGGRVSPCSGHRSFDEVRRQSCAHPEETLMFCFADRAVSAFTSSEGGGNTGQAGTGLPAG